MASPNLLNNTIALTTLSPQQHEEGTAASVIYPGMPVRLTTAVGEQHSYVQATGGAFKYFERIFAVENIYEGKSITDSYSIGEHIMLKKAYPGDVFFTKIVAVLQTAISVSTPLYPSGGEAWFEEWDPTDPNQAPFPIALSLEEDLAPVFPRWTAVRII